MRPRWELLSTYERESILLELELRWARIERVIEEVERCS